MNRSGFAVLVAALLVGAASPMLAAANCAERAEIDFDRAYELGFEAFRHNDFESAARQFEELFGEMLCRHHARTGEVAYALAQCARFRADFASAFYFYSVAAREYARYSNAEAAEWAAEAEAYLVDMAKQLRPVTVQLGPAAGTQLCDLTVDGYPLVQLDGDSVAKAFANTEADDAQHALLRALHDDPFVGGARTRTESRECRWGKAAPAEFQILLSRERLHTVWIDRRQAGVVRPARFAIDPTRNSVVTLADQPATLTLLPKDESKGSPAAGSIQATLKSARDGRITYPLPWKMPVQVAPGVYVTHVELFGSTLGEASGRSIELMPGEAVSFRVDTAAMSKDTPWYATPPVIVTAAVVVAGIVAVVAVTASTPKQREIDRGSLNWLVEVPK